MLKMGQNVHICLRALYGHPDRKISGFFDDFPKLYKFFVNICDIFTQEVEKRRDREIMMVPIFLEPVRILHIYIYSKSQQITTPYC